MHRAHVMTGGRYPVLRALGILYLLGAAGVLLYGLYWIGWTLFAAPASMGDRFAVTLQAIAATFFAVITILALAELIKLVIDIEHNTRMAALNAAAPTTMAVSTPAGDVAVGTTAAAVAAGNGPVNRMAQLDEESAEAALLRGH
jgi:hypothetical protein